MTTIKKNRIAALAFASIFTMTAGCKQKENESVSVYKDPEYRPFGKYDEPVNIKGVREYLDHNDSRVPSSTTPDNQKFIQILRDELNINFEYRWKVSPAQYENKLTSSILSKQYPDILKVTASQYADFKSTGLLADLTETYKYASPAVKKFLDRDSSVIESLKDEDGKIYAIPQYDDYKKEIPVRYYRKDWLNELGLSEPKNPLELTNVLTQFKTKKGATDGIALFKERKSSYFSFDYYRQRFGYQPYTWIDDGTGNLQSADVSQDAKDALTYFSGLYQDGLRPKDYASRDASQAESSVKSQKAGVVFGPWWQYEYPIGSLLQTQEWGCCPIPLAEGKKTTVSRQNISYYYVVLKQCKHPEALRKRINRYIDADGKPGCNASDGYVWSWCPTQFNDPNDVDETFLKINAQLKTDPTASQPAPDTFTSHEKKLWNAYPNYLKWNEDHGSTKFEENNFANIIGRINQDGAWAAIRKTDEDKKVKFNEFYGIPGDQRSDFGSQITTHTDVYFSEVITGKKNLNSTWDDYVKEWNNLHGKQISEEINAWYKSTKSGK